MPKSKNPRARLATAAGLTTAAVAAALIVAPAAAFAVTTVSPPVVPAGNTTTPVTIFDDTATLVTGATTLGNRVQILSGGATTCNATIQTPAAAIMTAPVVASSNSTHTVTFTMPSGLTAATNGRVQRYLACIYDTVGGTTARAGNANGYPISIGAPLVVNPASGFPGGGNTVNVSTGSSNAVFNSVATVGALFTTDNVCPVAYGTPTANLTATVNKTSDSTGTLVVPAGVTSTTADSAKYSLCLFNGNTGTSSLISAGAYTVTQITLSNPTGPYGGTNSLNINALNPILAGIDTPGAVFTTAATCPTNYPGSDSTGVTARATGTDVRKVTDTRLAVTVPVLYGSQGAFTTAAAGASSVPWQFCLYDGTDTSNSKPIAAAPYAATTLHTVLAVTPKAGSALGGSRITVSGTSFPVSADGFSATLGGAPLVNITPLTPTAFSATTPMHIPANNVALVVTTIAGSVTLTNAYSFTSALQVKPNTAPNTKSIDVVINGLGFQSSTWNPSGLPGAHIYLVDGVYASSQAGSDRANPGVAECGNVLVLSDSELICRLNLTSRLDAAGSTAYSVAPVGRAIDVVAGSKVVTNLGGGNTFSDLDLGKTVTDPGATPKIPVNTTIVRILSTTSAVLSNAASGTGTAVNVVVSAGGPLKTVSADTHTSTTVDAISPTLGSDDNGRYLFGPDIQAAGVTMSAQAGASVTISTAAGGGHSGVTLSVFPATATLPVPEGAYNLTYVSNGTVNAVANDANYVQSGLSSGSIFTVSAF